ncbi:peptidylprolyl isomerase [Candidatus Woesearchaeota archaeon]|jgi:FKBP-type peptidyl-prolyl cis-trans isomerase 2|nr:peptidylprolyl isomerase [Candidatus Woesearchaeota archaeon]MBT4368654.1 peptidylprolyl isomerase [Candidatus Woesearchaeota archaeon]MBT4712209.1 peptidylprolyl isomerase [Candidatus Woesearchaeota archaeon]MBT6638959.1 peptidylprolyl isomerase [Candidatus Woesearchaeota archaeon]MBT7134139.1 peptidylprolyl isomerase [Candidatus Woesearchaeota archaeon]
MSVKEGDVVKVHYTGKTEGEVFDSSEGKEPLIFKVGDHKVIKGFEDAVMGMKAGDKKTVTLPSDEAYGNRDEKLVSEVPKDQLGKLPDNVTLEKGMSFQLKDQTGNGCIATISEVKETSVMLDLNHPLAGKELTFDVELVEIMKPKE